MLLSCSNINQPFTCDLNGWSLKTVLTVLMRSEYIHLKYCSISSFSFYCHCQILNDEKNWTLSPKF